MLKYIRKIISKYTNNKYEGSDISIDMSKFIVDLNRLLSDSSYMFVVVSGGSYFCSFCFPFCCIWVFV